MAPCNSHGISRVYWRTTRCPGGSQGRPEANKTYVDRGVLRLGYQASEHGNEPAAYYRLACIRFIMTAERVSTCSS